MTNNSIFKVENLFNVKNWVVVVTGGGTGIGLMCAQAFANNGARVCR
jgi:NAD(P)-dependent dehydrogenase (short-subunit alcohol dehydrogenase family)